MINLLLNNFYILSKDFRKKLYYFIFLLFITIFFESMSIILLFQFVGIFFNSSDDLITNTYLHNFFNFIGIDVVKNKYYLFLFLILIYLFKTIFLTFFSWWKNRFRIDMKKNIGERLFKKYMFESRSYHVSKNSSEFVRSITIDIDRFTLGILESITLITEVLIIIFIGGILFYLQPFLTFLFCLIFLIFSCIWYFSLKKNLNIWGQKRVFHDGKIVKFLNEGFHGHKEIKVLNAENFFIKNFKFNLFNTTKFAFLNDFFQEIPRLWLEFLLVMRFSIIFIFLFIFKDFSFAIIAPILAAYSGAALRLLPSINRVITATYTLNYAGPVIRAFRNELKYENKNEYIKGESKEELSFNENITFKKINFSYSSTKLQIIKNFNFQIKKNEIIGITGPSGSGKSTLINLLMGLEFANEGSILIDNISLTVDNSRKWQKKIGYVPQTIFLTDDSIKKNIALGKEDPEINHEKIKQLITRCQLFDFVNKLKFKEETNVGELGSKISEGQKQRLGIARALYRDPDILVLDEFTSSLDVPTENEIMEIIKSFKGKKTIFIVSHKQNPIKYCNKVINLSEINKLNEKS